MEEKQVKMKYQINDNHTISQDVSDEMTGCSNLFINDSEIDNSTDKSYYDKKKRIKDMELCIKFDNYFATLASILNFVVETNGMEDSNLGIVIKKIEKDLGYLQENYTITERGYKDNSMSIF